MDCGESEGGWKGGFWETEDLMGGRKEEEVVVVVVEECLICSWKYEEGVQRVEDDMVGWRWWWVVGECYDLFIEY